VPLKLSDLAPHEWAEFFRNEWDLPSGPTPPHLSNVCIVVGDAVWVHGTTLEQIKQVHMLTLQLALSVANRMYVELLATRQAAEEACVRELDAFRRHLDEVAERFNLESEP
jgi:hypothetical protein